jgi:hypothetical protein
VTAFQKMMPMPTSILRIGATVLAWPMVDDKAAQRDVSILCGNFVPSDKPVFTANKIQRDTDGVKCAAGYG